MPPADKVSHASLNGIYVKAQELDRGHNAKPAPSATPPGAKTDALSHAISHASDALTHASDSVDAETHASACEYDAETHASPPTSF